MEEGVWGAVDPCGRHWQRLFDSQHVHDAGRVVKPEEAIKYPFKPADLERLEGPALAWVYRDTRGLKLAQPLGDFAEFWRALKHERLKVLLVDGPDGAKLRLVEKPQRPVSLDGSAADGAAMRAHPKTRSSARWHRSPGSARVPSR
jgi:hypothetical protein